MAKLRIFLMPLLVGIGSAFFVWGLGQINLVNNLELASIDARFNFRGKINPPDNVVIAAIDDSSQMNLDMVWPFPRDWHAQVIRNMHDAGARVITFDVFFDTIDKKNPGGDQRLSEAIKYVSSKQGNTKPSVVVLGGQVLEEMTKAGPMVQIVRPDEDLDKPPAEYAVVNQPLDKDGVVRKSSIFIEVPDFSTNFPSYSFAAAAYFLGLKPDAIMVNYFRDRKKGSRSTDHVKLGKVLIPVKKLENSIVFDVNYYGPPNTFETHPYQDFLLMHLDPNVVLAADQDGNGEPDNSVIFHNLLNVQSQFVPLLVVGSVESPTLLAPGAVYMADPVHRQLLVPDVQNGKIRRFVDAEDEKTRTPTVREITALEPGGLPSAIVADDKSGKAYAILYVPDAGGNASAILSRMDLETSSEKKRYKIKALPAGLQSQVSLNVQGLEELCEHTALLGDFRNGSLFALINGINGIVEFDVASMEVAGVTPLPFRPRQLLFDKSKARLFALGDTGQIMMVSLEDGRTTDFDPAGGAVSAIAYFGFDHKLSDESKNTTYVREKLYALNTEANALTVYNADSGKIIKRIPLPTEALKDFAQKKKDMEEMGQKLEGAEMLMRDITADVARGRIYVGTLGLVGMGGSTPHPGGLLLMLDAYVDRWFTTSTDMGAISNGNLMRVSNGVLFAPATQMREGQAFLKVLDCSEGERAFRDAIASRVKNRIVLIGPTAEALHDNFPTPFFEQVRTAGVEIHANAVQDMLTGNFVRKIGGLWTLTLMLFFGILAAVMTMRLIHLTSIPVALLSILGVMVVWVFFSWACFTELTLYIVVQLVTAMIAIVVFLRGYRRYAVKPYRKWVGALMHVVQYVIAPAVFMLFAANVAAIVHPGGMPKMIKAFLTKESLLNPIVLGITAAYVMIQEIVPFFAWFSARKNLMTSTAKPERKAIIGYRGGESWGKVAAFSVTSVVYAVLVVLVYKGEGLAAMFLNENHVDIFHVLARNLILPTVMPLLTIAVGMAVTTIYMAMTEGREKRQIKGMFSKYVSAEVVNQLIDNPAGIQLGGERKDLTILFSDIRGFTSISERLNAEQVVEFLNAYLSEMTRLVIETQGTLDKFIGDAVMAFWGAPIPQPNHRERGVRTALMMHKVLKEIKEKWIVEGRDYPDIRIGIGINSGEVVVGNIGSDMRMDYTVIGDHVNLASRLEGQCKTYGVGLVVSKNTYEAVKEMVWARKLDDIAVKGKKEPVTIFEILGMKD